MIFTNMVKNLRVLIPGLFDGFIGHKEFSKHEESDYGACISKKQTNV